MLSSVSPPAVVCHGSTIATAPNPQVAPLAWRLAPAPGKTRSAVPWHQSPQVTVTSPGVRR